MYAATDGTMSVNAQMANISFASYLRDCMNNQPNSLCRHYCARLPQPLPLQTTNKSHSISGAFYGPLYKPAVLHPPFDRHPQLTSQYNMVAEEPACFKDYVRDPEDLYLSANILPAPASYRQAAPVWPSWSAGNGYYAFPGTTPQHPLKVENSPSLHIPGVLPRNVDVSKYESLSYDDWYSAPTLYESSSPSSTGYNTDSPISPDDSFSDYSFGYHPTRNMQEHAMGSSSFLLPLQGIPDTTYRTTPAFPSVDQQATYSVPHGLPFSNCSFSSSPYERPVYAQFHHHHMMDRSLSPEELDIQTSSEVDDDDQHDDPSFTCPPPRTYMLAEDGVGARQQRDELLLSMRSDGHSYREIKRLGRFKEAESTLRGRHRALTKDKEERVRRPQWEANDETLLRQAVRHYTHGSNHRTKMKYGRRKLPWKKISQRMKDHGSSYLFAPATCAKKWESLGR